MTDVVTGEAVVLDVRVARLASRALARFIDLVIQLVVLLGVGVATALLASSVDAAMLRAVALICVVAVVIGYPVIWETLTRGRSPGKMVLGLRIVSADASPVRFRQTLVRALVAVIEVWALSCVPAVVVSLLSEHAQRLGDVFAGTIAIQERVPARVPAAAEMPPHLHAWVRSADLARLPDDVALLARGYLGRRSELDRQADEEMGRRVADTVARHVGPPPPAGTSAADYLAAVLAERRHRAQARMPANPADPTGAVPPDPAGPASTSDPPHPAGTAPQPPAPTPESAPPPGFTPPR